jgi:hypothetical protein
MSLSQLSWLIGLVLSILMGVLGARMGEGKRATGFVLAILTATLCGLVGLFFELRSIKEDVGATVSRAVPTIEEPILRQLVEDIHKFDKERRGKGPFDDVLFKPLYHSMTNVVSEIQEGTVPIDDRDEAVELTMALMEHAEETVCATSYIDPKEWWGVAWNPSYEKRVADVLRRVKHMERVFIVESSAEAVGLDKVMRAQSNIGIDVRCICSSQLRAPAGSDFIVIDERVVGNLSLDEGRRFKGSTFMTSRVKVEDFKGRFQRLRMTSQPWSSCATMDCDRPTKEGMATAPGGVEPPVVARKKKRAGLQLR